MRAADTRMDRGGGVAILNCFPMVTGPGLLAYVRWCATAMDWVRHVDNPRRPIDLWVLAGSLVSRRNPAFGMAGGHEPSAVADLSATWFRGAKLYVPVYTLSEGCILAETLVHEIQHVIDFVSGELSRMTPEECEARAYGAEATFWRRVSRLEAFRTFEALVADEARRSLEALVRWTPSGAHMEALWQMHRRATVASCLDVLESRGVAVTEDVLATAAELATRPFADGVRYEPSRLADAVVAARNRSGRATASSSPAAEPRSRP